MSSLVNINGTPRSSQLSPTSATLSPIWSPPKSPLPPHRLAKLANALGVSTPIPANYNPSSTSFLSRSFSESSGPLDQFRRSPTPSSASSMGFNSHSSSTSKYLLHVVPPMHLPHDSDGPEEFEMTPPPASASGYHTQFRRGTLVPVHPTLQGQLGAIAKEYALPSTAGMILYLVSSGQPSSHSSVPSTPFLDDEFHEPGPRLSEDIWKHLWTRVLQADQRDNNMLLPSRSPTPAMLTLGITAARSTPFLPQEANGPLRPLLSTSPIAPQPSYSFVTSPSTPSSISDMRSNSKSAPPSSVSQSEPGTPDTSVEDSVMRANSFDLPGLNSPSLIPILAKVEFDIDRRKAVWYEPWLRSRKTNHAKRAGSRASRKNSDAGDKSQGEEKERVPQIPLLTGRQEATSPLSLLKAESRDDFEADAEAAGYEPLPDTQNGDEDANSDIDDDFEFAEDSTARVSSVLEKKDPLDDVFGSDADTWAAQKAEHRATHEFNPNIVNLALTGADLVDASFNTEMEESRITSNEEQEVRALLDQMSRSSLPVTEDSPTGSEASPNKKHIPPPLMLVPKVKSNDTYGPNPLPKSATSGTNLPYLNSDSPVSSDKEFAEDEYNDDFRPRSPTESDKRSGTIFDDLDLGLDPSDDFDDDDPNDRRRSQYVMKAQLDEIERTLAQLSPRILKNDLEEEHSFHSATLSPNSPSKLTLSPGMNSDFFPPSPRLPRHPDPPEPPLDPYNNASWPAVPFSIIKDAPAPAGGNVNRPPSPPRLAVNGVTTSAPRSFLPHSGSGEISSESMQRKRELDEDHATYPPNRQNSTEPPFPLSPDPFGRFSSSSPDIPLSSRQSGTKWDTVTLGRGSVGGAEPSPPRGRARSGTTSRFSADSLIEAEAPVVVAAAAANANTKASNRGTLMSVKSIKNLWRKSNKGPSQPPSSAPSSGRVSPAMPHRPERPSQETMDLPDVPPLPQSATFGRYSPQIPPSRTSQEQLFLPQRPSLDTTRPSSSHSVRSSQEQLNLPQQRRPSQELVMPPPRRSQDHPPPIPPLQAQQLSVPYGNRAHSNNTSPIIPAQMLSGRPGANLDRLHFDQESPYPIRRSPPVRYSPRPPSPPPLPPIPEKEKIARKSILKWKSVAGNGQQEPPSEPRSSFERLNGNISRGGGRRPSLNNFSPDIPPSPKLPEHFMNRKGPGSQDYRHSVRSRLTNSSIDSTSPPQHQSIIGGRASPTSLASSRDSGERRPSIDSTQFEIVSPKVSAGLSYPYHGLDS